MNLGTLGGLAKGFDSEEFILLSCTFDLATLKIVRFSSTVEIYAEALRFASTLAP